MKGSPVPFQSKPCSGMGDVYRARDTKLGREVAVKVLPDALAGDRERCAPGSSSLFLASGSETSTERSRAVLVEKWFDELERLAPR